MRLYCGTEGVEAHGRYRDGAALSVGSEWKEAHKPWWWPGLVVARRKREVTNDAMLVGAAMEGDGGSRLRARHAL